MKKRIIFFICAAAALAACNNIDPEPTPVPSDGKLSCTMVIYGSCGSKDGNEVDIDHVNELIDAMRVGPTKKVNVIAQFNFASNDSNLKYVNGTAVMRLLKKNEDINYISKEDLVYRGCRTLADSNLVRVKVINEKLGEIVKSKAYSFTKLDGNKKVKLYLPSEISKFLDRAAKECPADHYLFCISGHGGGWDAKEDREITKALAFDINFTGMPGISAKNLVAGINRSGIASKIPVVYFNACQMNFFENICEYAACPATYALTSFKNTNGTNNEIVMKALTSAKGNNVSYLVDALLAAYGEMYQDKTENKKCDISLVNIKSMKTAAAAIKEFVPLLSEDYKACPDWYIDEIRGLNRPDEDVFDCDKDFSHFIDDLSVRDDLDPEMKKAVNSIKAGIQSSIVKTIYGRSCPVKKNLLIGAKFMGKDEYAKSRKEYAVSYDNNEFYKLTGWNTLFELFDDEINEKGE